MSNPIQNLPASHPQTSPVSHHPPVSHHQKHKKHKKYQKALKALKAQAVLKCQGGFQDFRDQDDQPTQRFLVGYVLNRETATRLGCIVDSLDPNSFPPSRRNSYWSPLTLENILRRDLPSKEKTTLLFIWLAKPPTLTPFSPPINLTTIRVPLHPRLLRERVMRMGSFMNGLRKGVTCHPPYVPLSLPSHPVHRSPQERVSVEGDH